MAAKTPEQVAAEKAAAEKIAAEQAAAEKKTADEKAAADKAAADEAAAEKANAKKPETKPKGYRVCGAVAVLRGDDKSERYLYQGAVFDGAAFSEESVKHNLSVGLIEKVK